RTHEQVLRGGLPSRTTLGQGANPHHWPACEDQNRKVRRNHLHCPVRALQGGRNRGRDGRRRASRRAIEMPGYHRILLKLSGEAMAGGANFGINAERVAELACEVAGVAAAGVEMGVVVGGGNIFRGFSAKKMDRVTADHMGMLATVINSLALSDALEQ